MGDISWSDEKGRKQQAARSQWGDGAGPFARGRRRPGRLPGCGRNLEMVLPSSATCAEWCFPLVLLRETSLKMLSCHRFMSALPCARTGLEGIGLYGVGDTLVSSYHNGLQLLLSFPVLQLPPLLLISHNTPAECCKGQTRPDEF